MTVAVPPGAEQDPAYSLTCSSASRIIHPYNRQIRYNRTSLFTFTVKVPDEIRFEMRYNATTVDDP